MRYFVNTPRWLSAAVYPEYIWNLPSDNKIYFTFDDGPHPAITSWVLDQLKAFDAKGSFFCVGNRLRDFPEIKERIRAEGHFMGSHTFNHVDGWKTGTAAYLQEINEAAALAGNYIFRPPYGHIRRRQARALKKAQPQSRIIMWQVLTGDFDVTLTPQQCLAQSIKYLKPGAIVVLHDSEKAWPRLQFVLPELLRYARVKHWKLDALPF